MWSRGQAGRQGSEGWLGWTAPAHGSRDGHKTALTVASLMSPFAVCPAQKIRPGTFTAGPALSAWCAHRHSEVILAGRTVVRLGGELVRGEQFARHVDRWRGSGFVAEIFMGASRYATSRVWWNRVKVIWEGPSSFSYPSIVDMADQSLSANAD